MYKKPANLKYTDMCKYIDEHIYEETNEEIETTIFIYLTHIVNMLAHKNRLFNKNAYYEDFAIYMATELYLRLKNPKQFQLDENGNPQLDKVKSILNYAKKTLYPRKVDFEQKYYSQTISPQVTDDIGVEYHLDYSFSDKLSETVDSMRLSDFSLYLGDIIKTIRKFLSRIPYHTVPSEFNPIYLSCMLTFLNDMTLDTKDLYKLYKLNSNDKLTIDAIDDIFYKNSMRPPILFHVPDSMANYIKVLTREMRHVIYEDLSSILHTYIPSNMNISPSMILSEINNTPIDYTEDSYV